MFLEVAHLNFLGGRATFQHEQRSSRLLSLEVEGIQQDEIQCFHEATPEFETDTVFKLLIENKWRRICVEQSKPCTQD